MFCKPVSWVKDGGPGTYSLFRSLRKQQGYFQDSLCAKGYVLPSNWCSLGMKSDKAVYVHPTPCAGWYWLLCPKKGILNSGKIQNTSLRVLLIRSSSGEKMSWQVGHSYRIPIELSCFLEMNQIQWVDDSSHICDMENKKGSVTAEG